ncbi:UNVERIFIED_CONTAM: OTU family cysteine protease, putative [Hammondia hammondi]|eukprot:XP_008886924.1 OTU family cysteine protease, putative [Hammondia hammondi]
MKQTRGQKQGPNETQTDLRGVARSSLKPTKTSRVSEETLLVRTASRRRTQLKTSLEMNGIFQRLRLQSGCRRGHQPLLADHQGDCCGDGTAGKIFGRLAALHAKQQAVC